VTRTFLEKYGRAGTGHPDFVTGIIRMGADAPIPQRARSAAVPDGTPPRRIREGERKNEISLNHLHFIEILYPIVKIISKYGGIV
jgi:hypothetical protein